MSKTKVKGHKEITGEKKTAYMEGVLFVLHHHLMFKFITLFQNELRCSKDGRVTKGTTEYPVTPRGPLDRDNRDPLSDPQMSSMILKSNRGWD